MYIYIYIHGSPDGLAVDNAAYPRSAGIIYFSPLRGLTVNPMMGLFRKAF